MTHDLFSPPKPLRGKMKELARWARQKSLCRTSDVMEWGVENYYVSAVRSAQLLADRGWLRRLTDQEMEVRIGKVLGQGVWEPTEQLMRANLS